VRVDQPAFRFALIYTVIGIGWVLLSGDLARWVAPELLAHSSIFVWPGLVFVLSTALILYLATRRPASQSTDLQSGETQRTGRGALIVVFGLLAGVIVSSGVSGVAYTARHHKEAQVVRLKAIADLKSRQISAWLEARGEHAALLSSDDELIRLYRSSQQLPEEGITARLRARLEAYRHRLNYQEVLLLGDEGPVARAVGGERFVASPVLLETVRHALETGRIRFTDLYRSQTDPTEIHIDFVAPLSAVEGQPRLAVVLRVNPHHFLYPFIQSWPVPSKSAETLLFRSDGDHVLFLNELRHRSDTALKQRVSLGEKRLLAVQALEGRLNGGEVVEGIDYRQVEVVGVAKRIEGTAWYLIAKVDKEEIYAQAKSDAGWIALVAALILLVTASAFRLIDRRLAERLFMIQNRQQAEKLQALQLLDSIAEGSTDGIYAKDQSGRYLLVNRALCRFLGKTRAEILGREDDDVLQPVDAERLKESDRQVLSVGHIATSEEMWRTAYGIRTFMTTRGPLQNQQGKAVGVFGIARDITERKQQERDLRASEARFRAIFNGVSAAILLHDPKSGAILDVNAQMTQMYGYDRKAASRLRIADLSANTPPYTEHEALTYFANAEKGEAPVFEWLARHRNGSLFWVEMSVRRAEIAGRICNLVLARDIRERKQAEHIVRERILMQEQINLLSQAVEQSPSSIMITDTAGNIEYVNRRFTQVTGYTKEELIGQNPRILRSDATPPEVHHGLWEAISTGQEWSGQLQNRKKNGELFYELEHIIPIRDTAGRVTNYLAVKEEVSEGKHFGNKG
jgi:PAS domain S-box-containing protein